MNKLGIFERSFKKRGVFLFFMFLLFFINFSCAFEFDNVKSYNPIIREAIISNSFLGIKTTTIGKARLNTPLNVQVGVGYQKVAEFSVESERDYINFLKQINIFDKNKKNWKKNKITRKIDIKRKVINRVRVFDYSINCEKIKEEEKNNINKIFEKTKNNSRNCQKVKKGFHYENRVEWVELNNKNLVAGDVVIIGLFTIVKEGDYVEWVPKLYGVDINEWASWTASLNTDLVSYYELNEQDTTGSGNIVDSYGSNNGTNHGPSNTTGKIKTAYDFDGSNDYIESSSNVSIIGGDVRSLSWWSKSDNSGLYATAISYGGDSNYGRFWISTYSSEWLLSTYNQDIYSGIPVTTLWQFHTITYNGSTLKWFLNGTKEYEVIPTHQLNTIDSHLMLGQSTSGTLQWNGIIDEVGIWNRVLNETEVKQLYNNGTGLPFNKSGASSTTPVIIFNSPPSSNYTISPKTLTLNFSASDGVNLSSVKLYVNETLNQTNASGINNTYYLFNLTLTDGEYKIYGKATNNNSQEASSESRTFIIDSLLPQIDIFTPSGLINSSSENYNLTLNFSASDDNLEKCWYVYGNVFDSFENNLDGWTIHAQFGNNRTDTWSTVGNWSAQIINVNRLMYKVINATSFTFDYSKLQGDSSILSIIAENGTTIWTGSGTGYNQTVSFFYGENITFKIAGGISVPTYAIDNIRYENYVNCSNNDVSFEYIDGYNNLTVYASDTLGNRNNKTTSWSYLFDYYNISYNATVYEGGYNPFILQIKLNEDNSVTEAIFEYNNTNYSTSTYFSDDVYFVFSSLVAPAISDNINVSFGFYIVVDGKTYFIDSLSQEILNVSFGNCSGGDVLFRLSLFDEDSGSEINGTMEINANIRNKATGLEIDNFNSTFTSLHSANICLTPRESWENYLLTAEVKYYSNNYAPEFFNIQHATMESYPKNISLFDLSLNKSTEFLIRYQDNNLIFVEGAIIQLQRKYIGEDIYRVVEAPKTSASGTTILHINLDTNIYRAAVVKDGKILNVFDNIVFHCENELSGICYKKLLGNIDSQTSISTKTLKDFSYYVTTKNETITTTYSSPSGTPNNVNILITQEDGFSNNIICNKSIISSAGSIDCNYSKTIGDSIILLRIQKNDDVMGLESFHYSPDSSVLFNKNNFFIVFILSLSLVGLSMTSPEWMVINAVMSLVVSGSLWLLNGMNIVVGLGIMAWIFLSAGIILYKLTQENY